MLNRILITSIGGGLAAELIKNIKKQSKFKHLKIFGADMSDNNVAKFFVDKFFIVPDPLNKNYVKKLTNIIKKNNINLVLPGSDFEALALSKNRKKFEKQNCFLASIDHKSLLNFSDKQSTYEILKKNNLPCANFNVIKNNKDLSKIIKSYLKDEFVIKPSISIGGRGVTIFRKDLKKKMEFNSGKEIHIPLKLLNVRDLLKKYYNKYPLIISERLFSPTYDIDMLAYKGKPINVVARERLNPQVPNDGHCISNKKKVLNIGNKIIEKFNLSWLYDCDCMTDKNGNIKIIEINPRMSGSLATSILAGFPLIDNLLAIINKKKFIRYNLKNKITIMPYKTLYKK
jgi:carbamoyl-phosphate synthase large subunit